MDSLYQILAAAAPERPALGALDRSPSTYGDLLNLADAVRLGLAAQGIAADRVAIVLPNGPEMAATFLSVGTAASTAPLNPAYRAEEFDFYLGDLGAKALIVEAESQSPAIAVARDKGIAVLRLLSDPGAKAGQFALQPETKGAAARPPAEPSGPEHEALVLHTSGTTSRPKLVPLKQRNIAASARHIARTLALTPDDIGLNIMPLFHIHGLLAGLTASLVAGAQVVATPGFNALKIFQWFAAVKPSWYSAVPTMHQAILARAKRNPEILAAMGLRFVRSSSSSLPAPVMAELEETFDCPVVECYGMTEAAHQMASNQLPPGRRRAGSVGFAAGPEIAILDPAGAPLPQGETGEISIRGPNVFEGYENNPAATAEAFSNGWFRTGDQGYFDPEGFLIISGRLKEIINRGGEKIAPREVDDILQAHPAVAQVVTFALPHDKLGEEVAAVVVLAEGEAASERELRDFAAAKLADFKVPRKIIFRDEIPKGATGKLQRIGLAEKLGFTA